MFIWQLKHIIVHLSSVLLVSVQPVFLKQHINLHLTHCKDEIEKHRQNALDPKALVLGNTDTPRRALYNNNTTILKFKKASKKDEAVAVPSHCNFIISLL